MPAQLAPGQTCAFVTQAHADGSAGTPNVNHDGSPLAGIPAPDISRGFQGIPRSAQPPLTPSQQRILECTYRLAEANADMPYALFIPSRYTPGKPAPVIMDLHGLSITPLMQMLFDGTTDFAERYGFIVVAPMGFSVSGWWGARSGTAIATAATKPGTDAHYSSSELSELDAMTVLQSIRQKYAIDSDRIYLMGHSMGGAGTYYLGGKYNDIWAGIAPISGAGGIADAAAAERYRRFATLLMHGDKDSIVSVNGSRHAAMFLQSVGAQHVYLEFPGKDHEFWIRRGAENMEKVFLFFATVSRRTHKGFITPDIVPADRLATVAEGVLAGTTDNGVTAFLGVPFAAPPVGDLRWAPPRPPARWGSQPRPAKTFGAACTQTLKSSGSGQWTSEYMSPAEPGVSEDCLFLNIWTPATPTGSARLAANLPVLFYIYGGGFNEGSGAVPVYNGANLAKKGVVVVVLNYRVGSLGFMAHPELTAEQNGASGNYGIQDQIAALHWVHDNIKAFGGDASKVTIAGQSAGGMSVQALLISPAAKSLFRAAIIQSPAAPGTNGSYTPRATAEEAAVSALERAGAHSIKEARAMPAAQANSAGGRGGLVADGRIIPLSPTPPVFASDVPVMIGYTLNDLFVMRARATAESWNVEVKERYGDQAGEFLKYYPGSTDEQAARSAQREAVDRGFNLKIVDWLATRGATQSVFAYLFTHVEPGPESTRYGAFHTSEVPYEFDTLHLSPGRNFTDVDRQVANQFSSYVANFTKTGDPNGPSLPRWPAMTAQNKVVLDLGDQVIASRAVPLGADAVIAAGRPPARGGRGGGRGNPATAPNVVPSGASTSPR